MGPDRDHCQRTRVFTTGAAARDPPRATSPGYDTCSGPVCYLGGVAERGDAVTEDTPGAPSRSHRLRAAVACGIVAACVGGCGSQATIRSATPGGSTSSSSVVVTPRPGSATSASISASPATPAANRSASTINRSTIPARPLPTIRPPRSSTATTSSQPVPHASRSGSASVGRASTHAKYDTDLMRVSRSFGRASSQFSALVKGAPPAEVGAAAPTYAAAAANFEHGLSKIDPPAQTVAGQFLLQARLKQLSRELTNLADDSQTGDAVGARAQLEAVTRTNASVLALRATLGARSTS